MEKMLQTTNQEWYTMMKKGRFFFAIFAMNDFWIFEWLTMVKSLRDDTNRKSQTQGYSFIPYENQSLKVNYYKSIIWSSL